MADYKQVAIGAAREAGKVLLKLSSADLVHTAKGTHDIVTQADTASEKIIIDAIRDSFPDHGILAEESGGQSRTSDYLWVIDPLDGTIGYARGLPDYSLQIALEYQKEIVLGIVYHPVTGDMFVAEKGKGATCNNMPMHVSKEDRLVNALIAVSTTSDLKKRRIMFQSLTDIGDEVRQIRAGGSGALNQAWIGAAKLECNFSLVYKYWDYSAGTLIVQEAGGTVTDFDGNAVTEESENIIATNGILHERLLQLLSIS